MLKRTVLVVGNCVPIAGVQQGLRPGRCRLVRADVRQFGDDPCRRSGEQVRGYGIRVCRQFVDEVHYNEWGNQVTLVKYFPRAGRCAARLPADGSGEP